VQIDLLQSIPPPDAAIGVLYLYRGRAFIVYWIGAWLMLAGALLVTTQRAADPRLGSVLLGLALLLIVFAAGLLFLAVESFPTSALRWTVPIRVAAGSAVWFLVAPFIVPLNLLLFTGVAGVALLMG
jgi:hypothetical protein